MRVTQTEEVRRITLQVGYIQVCFIHSGTYEGEGPVWERRVGAPPPGRLAPLLPPRGGGGSRAA